MLYDYIVETLIRENEPSLRLLAEWIITRLISEDKPARLNDLYEHLREAHRHRTGTVCAWLSIASHVTSLLSDRIEQVDLSGYLTIYPSFVIRLNVSIKSSHTLVHC